MISWLRRLIGYDDSPDPKLQIQTPRYSFQGYDEAKAIAGARAARKRTASGKPIVKPVAKSKKQKADIVPIRKAGA